jgi:hypothetical protein
MNFRKLALAIATASTLAAAADAAAGEADFTMINKTGYSIREVYISAANRNAWGRDRLGENATLENNKSRLFKFRDRASCSQDIKVVFDQNDAEVTWEDIDLCEVNKLTLKYNAKTKEVSAIKE